MRMHMEVMPREVAAPANERAENLTPENLAPSEPTRVAPPFARDAVEVAPRQWPTTTAIFGAEPTPRRPLVTYNPTLQVKYFHDLGIAYMRGRKAYGAAWQNMPFAPYRPYLEEAMIKARGIAQKLHVWGHGEDAQLAHELAEQANDLIQRGSPYLASNLFAWYFANVANVYDYRARDRQHWPQRYGVEIPGERSIIDGLRANAGTARKAVHLAIADQLFAPEDSAQLREDEKTLTLAYWASFAARPRRPETDDNQIRIRAKNSLRRWAGELDSMSVLESTLTRRLLEPALSLLIAAVETLEVAPELRSLIQTTKLECMDAEFLRRLDAKFPLAPMDEPAWRAFFEAEQGSAAHVSSLVTLVMGGQFVPSPTFASIGKTAIAAAFAMRIAPLGTQLRYYALGGHSPSAFLKHDQDHALARIGGFFGRPPMADNARYEEWKASGGRSIARALPPFMRENGPDDDPFFTTAHENCLAPATSDPRLADEIVRGFAKRHRG